MYVRSCISDPVIHQIRDNLLSSAKTYRYFSRHSQLLIHPSNFNVPTLLSASCGRRTRTSFHPCKVCASVPLHPRAMPQVDQF
jgi:hypothetical protein